MSVSDTANSYTKSLRMYSQSITDKESIELFVRNVALS